MTNTDPINNGEEFPAEFSDIAPYSYKDFKQNVARLVDEEGFQNAIRYIMPEVDYPEFRKMLLSVENIRDFQNEVAGAFLEYLAQKTTAGVTLKGIENVRDGESYTFISNHRDIVLDASFLNMCFIRTHKPVTQIAIGNNLLIYDWIKDLVRINRSFIVKRDAKPLQALKVAKQLSEYIHYTITRQHESVWIAQREGRAKDSNDVTQESLLKMLTLGGGKDARIALTELNILPVSISYEFDPNDYLKVKEFLLRRRDPEFKKSQHDDLFSMETGILQFKGHVNFTINPSINKYLEDADGSDRNSVVRTAREAIDLEIHKGYEIFPINYIAYDRLEGTREFAGFYDDEEEQKVNRYFNQQAALIDVDNITDEEKDFINEMFLRMYANPLINKLEAESASR